MNGGTGGLGNLAICNGGNGGSAGCAWMVRKLVWRPRLFHRTHHILSEFQPIRRIPLRARFRLTAPVTGNVFNIYIKPVLPVSSGAWSFLQVVWGYTNGWENTITLPQDNDTLYLLVEPNRCQARIRGNIRTTRSGCSRRRRRICSMCQYLLYEFRILPHNQTLISTRFSAIRNNWTLWRFTTPATIRLPFIAAR